MKISVVANTKRNIVFGVINKAVVVLCPIISRAVILKVLGRESLGLNSLFSSILSVLSLSELGVGAAIVYNMYRAVAEDNTDTVCALLNFYRKVYAIIGAVILFIGLCCMPFLPWMITGAYPKDINIYVLFLMYLANTTISYFMFAYMSSLIIVYQRDDVNSRVNLVTTLLLHGSQIGVLYLTQSYYLFLLMLPLYTILNNLRIAYMVRRMFPQYRCVGKISKEMKADIKVRVSGAFISKVCATLRNSLDSICLSAFIGLAITAVYNNYYQILLAISAMTSVIGTALQGGVGNHVVTRTKEANFDELRKADFAYMWLSAWCTVCLLCLYQPFMEIWMGSDMLFPFPLVVLFCGYFYLLKIGDMRSIYATANGLWWQHRYRSFCEAAGNLCLNVVLGKFFGVYGIIVATMITLFFFNFIWSSQITFKHYFGAERCGEYFRYHTKYMATMVVMCSVSYALCGLFSIENNPLVLLIRGAICLTVPNLIWIGLYHKDNAFRYVLSVVTNNRG